jgi:hypothetical protein
MTDTAYLSIQLFLVLFLSFVDGLTAITQHPEWFQ